ncbi:MAG: hypothetical protein ACOVS5_14005, partial [Oligoflexus sp.]
SKKIRLLLSLPRGVVRLANKGLHEEAKTTGYKRRVGGMHQARESPKIFRNSEVKALGYIFVGWAHDFTRACL